MPDSDRYRRGLVGRSAPSSDDHWTDGLDGVSLPVDGQGHDLAQARRRRVRLTQARQERKRRRADEALWRQPLCTR